MYPLPLGTKIEEFATKERFPHMREFRYDEKNNFLWVDSIVGGTIPNNFLPAVEKGFRERMERGVIAGYQVQNLAVEVHFGKYHDVDSSEAAFKTAGSMAFRNVFQQAKPSLAGADRHAARHRARRQARRHQQRHVRARGRVLGMETAGGGLQTVSVRRAAGRSHDLRPQPLQHHRRAGQLHDGVQPLRRRARQRAEGDHRKGRDEGGGRGVASIKGLVFPSTSPFPFADRIPRLLILPSLRPRMLAHPPQVAYTVRSRTQTVFALPMRRKNSPSCRAMCACRCRH